MKKKVIVNAIAEVNIYDYSPQDLPDFSLLKNGDLEWYFFCPKSKKYTIGPRSNRATEKGFWKATGKDRKVEYNGRVVATIKTLVFHLGHTSNGERTNWVMHEYNMKDQKLADEGIIQDMYVLCKIFEKEGVGPKNGAQYGAPFNEEEWDDDADVASCSLPTNKPDYKQKGPVSMSLNEPSSSTLTFSANETENNYKQKGPFTVNKIMPQSRLTETVTRVDTPVNDDVLLYEYLVSALGVSTEDPNGNNINKEVEVEVDNGKEVKGMGVNEDEGIFGDLVNLVNLDDFIGSESNKFESNGAEYTLDMIMGADDLDVDLGRFCVD